MRAVLQPLTAFTGNWPKTNNTAMKMCSYNSNDLRPWKIIRAPFVETSLTHWFHLDPIVVLDPSFHRTN